METLGTHQPVDVVEGVVIRIVRPNVVHLNPDPEQVWLVERTARRAEDVEVLAIDIDLDEIRILEAVFPHGLSQQNQVAICSRGFRLDGAFGVVCVEALRRRAIPGLRPDVGLVVIAKGLGRGSGQTSLFEELCALLAQPPRRPPVKRRLAGRFAGKRMARGNTDEALNVAHARVSLLSR